MNPDVLFIRDIVPLFDLDARCIVLKYHTCRRN
jgi:hypothetical protein